MTKDVRALVREGKMSRFQLVAVIVCMAINALDGFDVLSIAFTGPKIAIDWHLTPIELGTLFSAGLAGMVVGSLLLSPLADAVGRRILVLLGLTVITVGMALSAFAHDLNELFWLRAFTGVGIGSLLSSINTIVTEYASQRRQHLAVSVMAVGYPIGATIGGTIAVFLIAHHGWRSVFLFGSVLSALLIPIVLMALPESIMFLLAKRRRGALEKINALLARMGKAALTELPQAATSERAGIRTLLSGGFIGPTLIMCAAYFLTMIPFYFMLNWTPKVLVDQGLSISTGISGAVVMNGVGIVGGLLFGALANRVGLKSLTSFFLVMFFVAIAAFGAAGKDLALLLPLAGAVGFFMIGLISGLYAMLGALYPIAVRNTGTGLALGLGRFGAVVGPTLGGVLIGAGWTRPAYCAALAAPLLLSAILVRFVPLLKEAPAK